MSEMSDKNNFGRICIANEIQNITRLLYVLQIWFQAMENAYTQDKSQPWASPCTAWARELYHCSLTGQMHTDELVVLPSTNPIRYENHTLLHKTLTKPNTNLSQTLWRKCLFAFLF